MSPDAPAPLRITSDEASRRLSGLPQRFAVLFERGDVMVEFYAPRGVDPQQPHDRDEIYVVATGTGTFRRGAAGSPEAERVPFGPGDVLFVPAGVPHAFEEFGDDFGTWVIFFGPPGGR